MNFVGGAIAHGVSRGISHGVACNVSGAVSKGIKKACSSTSKMAREQNIIPNPLETQPQKVTKKVKHFVSKLKKKVKSLCSRKKSTINTPVVHGRPENRFEFI